MPSPHETPAPIAAEQLASAQPRNAILDDSPLSSGKPPPLAKASPAATASPSPSPLQPPSLVTADRITSGGLQNTIPDDSQPSSAEPSPATEPSPSPSPCQLPAPFTVDYDLNTLAAPSQLGKKRTASQRRRDGRNAKKAHTDPNGIKQSARQFAKSIAYPSSKFDGPSAPHASDGYIGLRDEGLDFNFLAGTHAEQVDQLTDRKYDFIDPPRGYVRNCSAERGSENVLTILDSIVYTYQSWIAKAAYGQQNSASHRIIGVNASMD